MYTWLPLLSEIDLLLVFAVGDGFSPALVPKNLLLSALALLHAVHLFTLASSVTVLLSLSLSLSDLLSHSVSHFLFSSLSRSPHFLSLLPSLCKFSQRSLRS